MFKELPEGLAVAINHQTLVYMRKYVDSEITAAQMKQCSDFLYECRFEEFDFEISLPFR